MIQYRWKCYCKGDNKSIHKAVGIIGLLSPAVGDLKARLTCSANPESVIIYDRSVSKDEIRNCLTAAREWDMAAPERERLYHLRTNLFEGTSNTYIHPRIGEVVNYLSKDAEDCSTVQVYLDKAVIWRILIHERSCRYKQPYSLPNSRDRFLVPRSLSVIHYPLSTSFMY